jgi:hypothetical protein
MKYLKIEGTGLDALKSCSVGGKGILNWHAFGLCDEMAKREAVQFTDTDLKPVVYLPISDLPRLEPLLTTINQESYRDVKVSVVDASKEDLISERDIALAKVEEAHLLKEARRQVKINELVKRLEDPNDPLE